jgi:hypothetical protein
MCRQEFLFFSLYSIITVSASTSPNPHTLRTIAALHPQGILFLSKARAQHYFEESMRIKVLFRSYRTQSIDFFAVLGVRANT